MTTALPQQQYLTEEQETGFWGSDEPWILPSQIPGWIPWVPGQPGGPATSPPTTSPPSPGTVPPVPAAGSPCAALGLQDLPPDHFEVVLAKNAGVYNPGWPFCQAGPGGTAPGGTAPGGTAPGGTTPGGGATIPGGGTFPGLPGPAGPPPGWPSGGSGYPVVIASEAELLQRAEAAGYTSRTNIWLAAGAGGVAGLVLATLLRRR